VEAESFEVQAKGHIADPETARMAIKNPEIEILYYRHYHEYDTYFSFADLKQGRLRYREDEFIDPNDNVASVRYRLTLLGPARERDFPGNVLLSRSRFLAPASHSLRFYREYFKPSHETFIKKDRSRWRVLYHGLELYVNLDQIEQPDLGCFIEIKTRTWSRLDAERKAQVAQELIALLGVSPAEMVSQDYVEIMEKDSP
jgi:5-methylthioadenosine/S-adenosylhomocysteine deaminase